MAAAPAASGDWADSLGRLVDENVLFFSLFGTFWTFSKLFFICLYRFLYGNRSQSRVSYFILLSITLFFVTFTHNV